VLAVATGVADGMQLGLNARAGLITRGMNEMLRLGLALGQGIALDDAVRQIGQVVESVVTADEVSRLAEQHGLELPIANGVRAVLHGEVTPVEGVRMLMSREQKPEYPQGLFG
jgi:glycerol-3-phosphate dehydrogenase (NAD(P)+)